MATTSNRFRTLWISALLLTAGAAGPWRAPEPSVAPGAGESEQLERRAGVADASLPDAGAVLRATTLGQIPGHKDSTGGFGLGRCHTTRVAAAPRPADTAGRSRAAVAEIDRLAYASELAASRSGTIPFRGTPPPPLLHG